MVGTGVETGISVKTGLDLCCSEGMVRNDMQASCVSIPTACPNDASVHSWKAVLLHSSKRGRLLLLSSILLPFPFRFPNPHPEDDVGEQPPGTLAGMALRESSIGE
jgi:hypothetical protein